MNWARRQQTGSASRKAVLMAVADYADENGLAWPSQRRIADDTELTDRTVRTAIGELIELGLLARRTKRRPDGTRDTDRLQLLMADDMRKEIPLGSNRKQLLPDEQPENDNRTTGNPRHNHRKLTTKPPEAVSAKPITEPPVNLQQNRSEAIASGSGAAGLTLSPLDRCWIEGKANLMACGASERTAGSVIGVLLRQGQDPVDVLAASEAAVEAGTKDPVAYVQGVLRRRREPRAQQRERSSAATRFRDRMEARHEQGRDRAGAEDHGPVIEHESDERPRGALH